MADRVRVSLKTIARLLSERGIDLDETHVNGADAAQAVLDKLAAGRPPSVAIVPVPTPGLGHPAMSALMPALPAHLPFSTPLQPDILAWLKAVVREELAGFQPRGEGEIWIRLPVHVGSIRNPESGRTRRAPRGSKTRTSARGGR